MQNFATVWQVKGLFCMNILVIFGWYNPSHISIPEFGDDHFPSYFVGDTSTGMGSTKNRDKTSKTPFLEMEISRAKWQCWGDSSKMFHKQINTFSIHETWTFCEAHPVQFMTLFFPKFLLFWTHFRVFAIVSLKNLIHSKIGHAGRTVYFTREITPNEKYLIQLLSDCKVLLMTWTFWDLD